MFLQGSNFATETFSVTRPDGRVVEISHKAGMLNRIDRVTASNLGCEINQNHCENINVDIGGRAQLMQIASLYFQASPWSAKAMAEVLLDVAQTSVRVLSDDLEV